MAVAAVSFRFVLASVFLVAGFAKLLSRGEFAVAVQNYQLLSARASQPIGRLLPPLELVCGVLLFVGLGVRLVSSAVALLLLVFAGAVAINLIRGREIDCGCFGAHR